MQAKPAVFIGSSKEGLKVAKPLKELLAAGAETRIWNDGVFHLGETTIESLAGSLHEFDFAVLVLTPDDVSVSRNKRQTSPRDNVVFELGLFTGGLGRNRCYVVTEDTARLKIPTDLLGVTQARYRRPANMALDAALASVAREIQGEIARLGPRHRIDPGALAVLHDVFQFRAAIVGHWWERVMPSDSSALSYVRIELDPDRWNTRLTGLTYDSKAVHVANWESVACGEDPVERRLYYWWEGRHPARPAEPFEGMGQIDFRAGPAPFTNADGYFSDSSVVDLGNTRKRASRLFRCTAAEAAIMEAQQRAEVTALVRKMLGEEA